MKKQAFSTLCLFILFSTFILAYPAHTSYNDSYFHSVQNNNVYGFSSFGLNEKWTLSNGTLKFSSTEPDDYYYACVPGIYTDFTETVRVRWTGKSTNLGFGVIFRVTNHRGYSFYIANEGYYTFGHNLNNVWTTIVDWTNTSAIYNGYNVIKIVCSGSNIKCYINGVLVVNVNDYTFTSGYVGLDVSGSVQCEYDQFSLEGQQSVSNNYQSGGSNGSVAFSDNFNGTTTSFGQDAYLRLQNGLFVCSGAVDGRTHYTFINQTFRDCTISVKARWDGRTTDNGFGILFGKNGDSFYTFEIAMDGHYAIYKFNGTSWQEIVKWQTTSLVTYGFNNLMVTFSGYNIKAYLNNSLVINTTDYTYTGGTVGLFCSSNLDASFDDFLVTLPVK